MDVQIRPALVDDCPALARIMIDAIQYAFRGRVPDECLEWITPEESAKNWAMNFVPGGVLDQGSYLLVAEDTQDGVVGLAMAGPTTTKQTSDQEVIATYPADLHSLAVDPRWQRKGIGRRLVTEVAGLVLHQGVTSLLVRVLGDNPNRAFYERLGAVEFGSQPYVWEGYATEEILYGWNDLRGLSNLVR